MNKKIAIAAVFLLVGFFIGFMANSKTTIIYESVERPDQFIGSFSGRYKTASIMVPAVDEDKHGIGARIKVEIVPGQGRVLSNIDKILFYTDTQNSIRTARKVAEEKTGIALDKYDIIYTIETNATAIEGPSAGAALAAATIAALSGYDLKENVMITGAINHDGTIGRVSNVMEKVIGAGELNIDTLLVPLTQSTIDKFETRRYCEEIGSSKICLDEDIPKRTNLSEISGVNVIEAANIDEALKYLREE